MKVTFGRTQSYTSGWMGKLSHTDIKIDGQVIGEIKGRQNTSVGGVMMSYTLKWADPEYQGTRVHVNMNDSLTDYKRAVREALEARG